MNYFTLVKANFRSKKGTFIGVAILLFIITVCLCAVINIFENASDFEERELNRIGYGDITYWISDSRDTDRLRAQIESLDAVEKVELQPMLLVTYSVNGITCDSAAFGIAWEEGERALHIYEDDLSGINAHPDAPGEGEVYVPPSFRSLYHAEIGDEVNVHITGETDARHYRIAGYLEDPVAGSSIMGFKSIIFSEKDADNLKEIYESAGEAVLGRGIYAVRVTGKGAGSDSGNALQKLLNEQTDLAQYAIAGYQKTTIAGFMLLFQNIISGILLVFILVLLVVALIVIGRSITAAIEEDYVDMGILKAVGYTRGDLRRVQILQYLILILSGMLMGIPVSAAVAKAVNRLMIVINGVMITGEIPWLYSLAALGAILLLFVLFILAATARIGQITPIRAIRGGADDVYFKDRFAVAIHQKGLGFWLAVRQLLSGKKQYISACLVASLLVFFLSIMGRLGAWIGEDGSGLMAALNVSDYDLGVWYAESGIQETAEGKISAEAGIEDTYILRVTKGTLNNMEYIMYSSSKPEYYHILEGRTCKYANEIVITEFLAQDLGVKIGDTVQVAYQGNTGEFLISGIYQCPNDMGANFGMNLEGYTEIGGYRENDHANRYGFFTYYILKDSTKTAEIAEWLETTYGEDIVLDENRWDGLESVLGVLNVMNAAEYAVSVFFIAVVAFMTGHRILYRERRDLGIYKSLGFSSGKLRSSFAMRFAIITALGSLSGVMGSAIFTDPLASAILRMTGVSRITSHLDPVSMMLPAVIVTALFYGFAWLLAGRIRRTGAEILIVE